MDDGELIRYSRQIMLPEFDYEGQLKLKNSRILLIGLGGLGSPISMYLTAAGIGHLVLNDFDVVEESNLQRQIIHNEESIGQSKLSSAKYRLQSMNTDLSLTLLDKKLNEAELLAQIKLADVVVDASDNFATRYLINRLSFQSKTPLVSGAAVRFEGQLSVFNQYQNSPCYQCLYPDTEAQMEMTCAENGVIGPILGVIGSMQALEVVKILTGIGETLNGKLMLFDAKSMQIRQLKLTADPLCPICKKV